MTAHDHILIALLIIGVPAYEHFYGIEKMRRDMAEDRPGVRRRLYWQTIGIQWGATAIVLALWLWIGRDLPVLGLGAPVGPWFWFGAGLAVVAAAGLTVIQRLQLATPERRREAVDELKRIAPFLPRDRGEMSHFLVLCLTAGICEEIVYRGYLIWYASNFTEPNMWGLALAVVVPAAVFAVAHLYQGPRGMVQVFVGGVIFGFLYILTGSLWVPMALHAYVDINGGVLALHLRHENKGRESFSEATERG